MKSYYPPSDRLAIVDSGCRQLRLPRSNFSVAVVVEHRRRRCRCDPDFRAQLVSRVPTQRGRVSRPARQAVADIAAATDELQISAGPSIDAIGEARRAAIVLARAFDLGRIVLVDGECRRARDGTRDAFTPVFNVLRQQNSNNLVRAELYRDDLRNLIPRLKATTITWSTSVSRGLALLLALALGCGALGDASTRRWHGRLRAARRSVWTMLGARRFLLVSEVLAQAPTVALSVWHPPVLAPSNGRPRRRRPRGWRPRRAR
jgi:hypothetical protein